jgi:hypothetical protein
MSVGGLRVDVWVSGFDKHARDSRRCKKEERESVMQRKGGIKVNGLYTFLCLSVRTVQDVESEVRNEGDRYGCESSQDIYMERARKNHAIFRDSFRPRDMYAG